MVPVWLELAVELCVGVFVSMILHWQTKPCLVNEQNLDLQNILALNRFYFYVIYTKKTLIASKSSGSQSNREKNRWAEKSNVAKD